MSWQGGDYMSKNDEEFGEVIDLSDVSKARRGAEATFEQGLLDLLTAALPNGKAVAVTRYTVLRSEFPSDEEYRNAKQSKAAEIRKHFDRLVADGTVTGRVSINWHPVTGTPQVSLRP
jgi:hypothetical protein|tara:strand:+ start:172 stop:525 length:354 start_codon:yes stop_codon:yes gene_type:complete